MLSMHLKLRRMDGKNSLTNPQLRELRWLSFGDTPRLLVLLKQVEATMKWQQKERRQVAKVAAVEKYFEIISDWAIFGPGTKPEVGQHSHYPEAEVEKVPIP
ncbi:hypothetical protein AALO_G00294160 [Alosa alosa]|uniref:Uncharacterized protein n=1 Tax=Alosa alosa TaxID=278164 RepID=A0AAV6FHY4_9TELE|nr:hypothetical protein AALO_G00294160 [Alosa alosa]